MANGKRLETGEFYDKGVVRQGRLEGYPHKGSGAVPRSHRATPIFHIHKCLILMSIRE